MLSKRFWTIFLTVLGLVALWYGSVMLYRVFEWNRLRAQPVLTKVLWTVQEQSSERFVLKADYSFEVDGKVYSGTHLFKDSPYRNAWGAEHALIAYQNQSWHAWFDPSNPTHSSLEKRFPLKDCVYAITLLGIFLYFLFLSRWIEAKYPSRSKK
jgi:Protein of unknown function (DUF3592)